VGAGDSFLAALVWEMDRGRQPAHALAAAVAAGTAALLEPGTELARAEAIARIAPQVRVERLEELAVC
jgi:6-phosphofructokinase 2